MTKSGTATRCYYAADPKTRPDCQLTATVRVGTIALCSACAELRSTLGKGQPIRRLPTPTNADAPNALDWVSRANCPPARRATHAGRMGATHRQHQHTSDRDRRPHLGTTRQAAQQRFTGGT
jgi:hypothetical protein